MVGFYGTSTTMDYFMPNTLLFTNSCFGLFNPLDGTLCTGATTPAQSGPGSNGNEGVLHIPQGSRTGTSPPDALYQRQLNG